VVWHELKRPDYAARILLCNWLLQNMHTGVMDLRPMRHDFTLVVMSVHNIQIWNDQNPPAIHEVSLRSVNISVWCAIYVQQVIVPVFFQQTVN
jgi:hypothetical protein